MRLVFIFYHYLHYNQFKMMSLLRENLALLPSLGYYTMNMFLACYLNSLYNLYYNKALVSIISYSLISLTLVLYIFYVFIIVIQSIDEHTHFIDNSSSFNHRNGTKYENDLNFTDIEPAIVFQSGVSGNSNDNSGETVVGGAILEMQKLFQFCFLSMQCFLCLSMIYSSTLLYGKISSYTDSPQVVERLITLAGISVFGIVSSILHDTYIIQNK